ncbi:MAG TPA: helix-turn-helix transcriptional regulator [Phycisphaerae bacterium]|nr:helix-turn-helix transcriptional regulator [Phycisphaerae bacterium]
MNNYHRPLKLPANRQAFIERSTSFDDGCMAVGGFAAKAGQLHDASGSAGGASNLPLSGVTGIAKLVQWARREARLSVDQFAKKVGIDPSEVAAAESAETTPEPRVLFALSESLGVSYQKLLTLAGHRKERDVVLEREVLRFAAFSGSMDKLTKVEEQGLHDLLKILHE